MSHMNKSKFLDKTQRNPESATRALGMILFVHYIGGTTVSKEVRTFRVIAVRENHSCYITSSVPQSADPKTIPAMICWCHTSAITNPKERNVREDLKVP